MGPEPFAASTALALAAVPSLLRLAIPCKMRPKRNRLKEKYQSRLGIDERPEALQ
jgi:hypothetical protein